MDRSDKIDITRAWKGRLELTLAEMRIHGDRTGPMPHRDLSLAITELEASIHRLRDYEEKLMDPEEKV